MIGTNENVFPDSFLLTDKNVADLCKDFANHSSATIKLSKTHVLKIMQKKQQKRGFFSKLLWPVMNIWLQLMKSVLGPLAKSVLIPLGCRYSEKKNCGYGITTLADTLGATLLGIFLGEIIQKCAVRTSKRRNRGEEVKKFDAASSLK